MTKDSSPLFGARLGEKSTAASKYKQLQQEAARRKGALTWADAGAEDLLSTVASVTEDGAAILLAKTSDGGALVLRVIMDRDSVPFYAPDMAALNLMLSEVRSINETA